MSFQDVMREISEFLAAPLYTIGGTQGTMGTSLTVAFMILVTWWLFRLRALVGVVYSSDIRGQRDLDGCRHRSHMALRQDGPNRDHASVRQLLGRF